jgi:hypothetical protein
MSKKMDRAGARTPAHLEQKYAFERRFAETNETAGAAQKTADEAKKIASEISRADTGLSLKVQALDDDLNGEGGVHAQLALKVETDANGNLVSKVHIEGGKLTIETDNFTLSEDGTITAKNGTFEGVVTATEGKIGVWHLGKTNIIESLNTTLYGVDSLYTDLMSGTDKDGGLVSYRVCLTAKGVYVDGQRNGGESYFANKTWLEICDG